MVDTAALLRAYDAQMRMAPGAVPAGYTHEDDGPLLRIAGAHVGRIQAPRDVDASTAGAPILRRCGFHEITTSTHYQWTPPQ